jgi:hypothetical protein
MSIPAFVKTWQFSVNLSGVPDATVGNQSQSLLLQIKKAFIGGGSWTDKDGSVAVSSGNWTVVGSSNGTLADLAGTDYWIDGSTLSFAASTTSAHSWIVLGQTGLAANFQLLLDCVSAGPAKHLMGIHFSPNAGYVLAGTPTYKPTATDEVTLLTAAAWGASSAASGITRLHVMKNTDGSAIRVILYRSGLVSGFWMIDKAVNAASGWTYPVAAMIIGTSSAVPAANIIGSTITLGAANVKAAVPVAGTMAMYMTCEGIKTAAGTLVDKVTTANELSGEFPVLPLGLWCDTVGSKGRHGTLVDMWAGSSSIIEGSTYPGDGTKQLVQFQSLVMPWNRTTPLILT